MKFSRRTDWQTAPNPVTAKLQELRARGEGVLDLTESNPTRCGFSYLKNGLLDAFKDPENLTYAPDPRGLVKAREAVCGYYADKGTPVDPAQVFITANTSEAYGFLFKLLTDPGDGLLAPKPSYPLFDYLAGLHDAELVPYKLRWEGRWSLDWDSLQGAFSPSCRGIILVHPNNPTGHYVSPQERLRLRDFCRAAGLPVICDEVFLDYAMDGQAPQTFASESGMLTFTLSGISKILGLPQMKVSWIVVSGPEPERLDAMRRLEIIADTYLSAGAPAQNALPSWFRSQAAVRDEILARVRSNRDVLAGSGSGAGIFLPEGGWYGILRLPDGKDDEAWVLEFLEKDRVFVHPGYLFDFEEGAYAVLSLLTEPAVFREGLSKVLARTGNAKSA